MPRHIGLPRSCLKGDLDRLYVQRLLDLLRGSSLRHAIILAQELVHDDQGHPMENAGSFYVPNDYVLNLARKHPEFLPAVSIHPARPDALEELDRCLAAGAVMMKCLPNCQNINCNDRRFTQFWERMAEAKLPLLAHTGGEHTLPVVRPEYADPRILAFPLECGVTRHRRPLRHQKRSLRPRILPYLCRDDPPLSEIFMATPAPSMCPSADATSKNASSRRSLERMVHGSDFPVPVHGHFAWLRGFVDWKAFRRWERHTNILERDYQLKLAMGFPPEHFTRINQLLRWPSSRQAISPVPCISPARPPTLKKTGLDSQGVTEKPGEFSN